MTGNGVTQCSTSVVTNELSFAGTSRCWGGAVVVMRVAPIHATLSQRSRQRPFNANTCRWVRRCVTQTFATSRRRFPPAVFLVSDPFTVTSKQRLCRIRGSDRIVGFHLYSRKKTVKTKQKVLLKAGTKLEELDRRIVCVCALHVQRRTENEERT